MELHLKPKGNFQPIIIEPARGLSQLGLHELWRYRDLIYFLLMREIKGRYRQMALGPLWIILTPLVNLVIFTVIFGRIAELPSNGLPYPLFAYSALLPWLLFANTAQQTATSLVSYKHIIDKVYFPRLAVPLVDMGVALIDFLFSFVILLGMIFAYGYTPGWQIILLPIYIFLAMLTGLAIGLWAAAWIVHFRDVNMILNYGLRLWMYLTPVVYAASMVPPKYLTLYRFNPLTTVIDGVRWSLLQNGAAPEPVYFLAFIPVVFLLITGAYYFRHTERTIVDVV